MDRKTIQQLNQINTDFYNRVGAHYDASRLYVRKGWPRLIEHIKHIEHVQTRAAVECRVLDVGCGNAEFGKFLFDSLAAPLHYHGIDANTFLLNQAKQSIPRQSSTFSQIDLITNFDTFRQIPAPYHVAALHNVLHHVPSFARRSQLLASCAEKLQHGGLLIFTLWQFWTKEKWKKRIIPWATRPHIDPSQLEPHDYLLDWQRGTPAVRYCHFTDQRELEELLQMLGTKHLALVETLLSDGKEDDLNRYVILRKNAPSL